MLFLAPPVQDAMIVTLNPSDDVWVYPHSSDPARDETVRLFGSGGRSVAADAADADQFGYGYLRFTLPERVKNARIVGATLELTNVLNDDLTADDVAASPVEVRPLVGTFDEKTWTYTNLVKTYPDPKTVWGRGVPKIVKGERPKLSIDLISRDVKGVDGLGFTKALGAPGSAGTIAVALTSTVDSGVVGMKRIYKIYTKDTENETLRPRLVLKLGQ